jgi:3',5'-cyclic AMP phosphodiesterase CpdA
MSRLPARRIAHLSDLHFGTVHPGAPERLLADLVRLSPDLVVVSGDVTQRARADQFAAAHAFFDKVPAPLLAVPGNHDIPRANLAARFLDPFGRWRRHLGRSVEPIWQDDALLVVGINSVRSWSLHLDWSAGRLSPSQHARIAAFAAQRTGRALVLVMHHPPLHPADFAHRRPLADAATARTTFARSGAAAILLGHLHRPALIGAPVPELIAGTALSWRDGGNGNSYTVIDLAGGIGAARVRRLVDGAWGWAETLIPPPAERQPVLSARPVFPD